VAVAHVRSMLVTLLRREKAHPTRWTKIRIWFSSAAWQNCSHANVAKVVAEEIYRST